MTIGAEEAEEERGGAEVEAAGAEAEAEVEVEGGGDAPSGSAAAAAAAAAAAPLPLETAVVFFRNVIAIVLSISRFTQGRVAFSLLCDFRFSEGRASSRGQRRIFSLRSLCLGCDAPKKSSQLWSAVIEVFPSASRHSDCKDSDCISSRSLRNKRH